MRLIALGVLALAACTPQPAPANADNTAAVDNAAATMPPGDATAPAKACDAGPAAELVGRIADEALKVEALRRTGARAARVIAPGAMVTMDFREDRLNIHTDAANQATRFNCG